MDTLKCLPTFGPLDIHDYESFLKKSKDGFAKTPKKPMEQTIDNFTLLRYIDRGAFGSVYLIKNKETRKLYAAKVVKISEILEVNRLESIKNEKYIMERVNFPFITQLELFACDYSRFFFIASYFNGGNLLEHMKKKVRFAECESRFIGAQVVLALEYLQYLDIVYRDLKPENVVMDHTGYIKIVDLGFSKIVKTRTYTLCGTVGYIAPEAYLNKGYGKSVDWWALGMLLYEISLGQLPIFANNTQHYLQIDKKIVYVMPSSFSQELSDLIRNLLQVDLTKRFGNLMNGVNDIKDHAFFRPILWLSLLNRQLTPPYCPIVRSPEELNRKCSIDYDESDRYDPDELFKHFN